jgi:hypothetical protein
MKFHLQITLLSLLICSLSFAQKNKEFEKLKKYKRYEVIINPTTKYSWTYKYELKNGYITEQEYYGGKKLTFKCIVIYDTINNSQYTIELFDRNEGYKNDSIVKKEIDSIKNRIKNNYPKKEIIKKSGEYDLNGNLIKEEDSIWGKSEYKYDSLNNIIEYKRSDYPEKGQIKTISYKYDEFNNVIEINREFNYPVEFPIPVGGGRGHYKKENFRYVYNKDGLWIKKYWIVEGKELLIEKRKFYKN